VGRAVPPIGWHVTYVLPRRALIHPRPGETTVVTLVEFASRPGPPPKITGAREIGVAGRQVSLANRTKTTMYVAAWQTGAARYEAIADGSTPATIKTIIGCLP
jgi:hypothetical protein